MPSSNHSSPFFGLGPPNIHLGLVVFDKDGTLLDFDLMWATWAIDLAQRLERATDRPLMARLAEVLGFEPATGHVLDERPLAVFTMDEIYALTRDVLIEAGVSHKQASSLLAATWYLPDPLALARPLADLPALFGTLRQAGIKIGIATGDDRAPTEATLVGMGLAELVDGLVCADDGLPRKPAPDMLLELCGALGIAPDRTAMIGDSVVDLRMGRAAGAGLVIGVLSGAGTPELLAPHADALISSVAELQGMC